MVNPRVVIGYPIAAKACHVTNIAECSRRYGANAEKKVLEGIVIDVRRQKTATGRTSTTIWGQFDLGNGDTKDTWINIRSVIKRGLTTNYNPILNPCVVRPAPPVQQVPETTTTTVPETTTTDAEENLPPPPSPAANTLHSADTLRTNQELFDDMVADAATKAFDQIFQDPPAERNRQQQTTEEDAPQPAPPVLQNDQQQPTSVNHGHNWYELPNNPIHHINGPVPRLDWGVRLPTGHVWRGGCNFEQTVSRLDVFLQMFPQAQLATIVRCTNAQLTEYSLQATTAQEILRFFGIIILATKYEFTNRASLWSTEPITIFENAPNFGKTGMSRHRFDELWRHIRFGNQPRAIPDGKTSETYRWRLVDEFVYNFNHHRRMQFIPSEWICVDESISRWYGQGGHWINMGLPMYVAIDRKPESGCELQNAACGKTGVMLQIRLVKSAIEEDRVQRALARRRNNDNEGNPEGILHATKVILELIDPWTFSNRIVCADSYYASVGTALALLNVRLRFIGVVKTATRRYPMNFLNTVELGRRGDRKGLVSYDANGTPQLFAFVWMDRERRYFIASGSDLTEGQPWIRNRWRQVEQTLFAEPERVQLTVPQTKASQVYYNVCGKIDQHNRDRQDTLQVENKLKTHDWSMRVNLSLLSICFVDTWRVWSRMTTDRNLECIETQKEFYSHLAAELILNNYDSIIGHNRNRANAAPPRNIVMGIDVRTGQGRCGLDIHLTPTKRKRTGEHNNYTFQGRCRVCQQKSKYHCSKCFDDNGGKEVWLCHTSTDRLCFPTHLQNIHPVL